MDGHSSRLGQIEIGVVGWNGGASHLYKARFIFALMVRTC